MKKIIKYYKGEFAKPMGKLAFMCRCGLYFIAITKIILHSGWQVVFYAFFVAIIISAFSVITSDYQNILNRKNDDLIEYIQKTIDLNNELYKYKRKYGDLDKENEEN